MKIFTNSKKICLFVFSLCIFVILVITLKNIHLKSKEEELIRNVNILLEKNGDEEEKQINKEFKKGDDIGLIIIPSIEVKAPIVEGTTSDILKDAVGHFENTSLWEGNVALASHNRGSYAHYFSRINQLKNGEEIIYITSMGERRYIVIENKIIEETNVGILKDTADNTITLITCVTGKRDKRQCIIGIEIN